MHAYATRNRREGFALAVAILAIVVIGGLIAGVFFATTEQFRMGRNQQLQARAMAAAEYGQNRAIVPGPIGQGWNVGITNLAMGRVDSSLVFTTADGGRADVRVTRMGNSTYLVASQGSAGGALRSSARRRTSLLVTVVAPQLNMLGALTTRGATKIGGSSFINGNDTTQYPGWNCPPPGTNPPLPGLVTSDTTQIQTSGCSGYACLSGNPKYKQDPVAADTNTYFNYGSAAWNDLVATSKPAGGNPGVPTYNPDGSCKTSDINNWGDPTRSIPAKACESYFPVLYSSGDLQLTGGKGQGILLVGGNLKVTGGFQFFGPVIVRQDIDTQGTGGHFNGGVMAANVSLQQNTVLGNAVITYSSCVIQQVMAGIAIPRPLADRAWAELF